MVRQNRIGQQTDWNRREFSLNPAKEIGNEMPRNPQPLHKSPRGPTSRQREQHSNGHRFSIAGNGDASRISDRAQSATPFLSTTDILGNFKPPETQPVFKVEPTEPDITKLPLRSSRKTKHTRPSIHTIKPQQRQTGLADKDGLGTVGNTETDQSITHQDSVIDLTAEDNGEEEEEIGEYPRRDNELMRQQPSELPHFGPLPPFHPVASDKIPEISLQHIREQYRKDRVKLPANITTWQQLLEFASANTKPSFVTPALIIQWRNSPWSNGAPQLNVDPFPQRSSLFLQNKVQSFQSQDLFHNQNKYLPLVPNVPEPTWDARRSSLDSERALDVIKRLGPDTAAPRDTSPDRPASTPSTKRAAAYTRSRARRTNATREVSNVSPGRDLDTSQRHDLQAASILDIPTLMRPSEALPDLLPSSAPSGHPHLVPVWHPYLLKLPRAQHDHLDLIDTVVSIMAKYDMKEQSVVKAFLDMREVQHFFFLFKSRTNAWHSWSVEREYNIVTIGLERNNRAANTTESSRPSSGQFDVTVQYKMGHPTSNVSKSPDSSPTNLTDTTSLAVTNTHNPSAVHTDSNLPSSTESIQSSTLSPPAVQETSTIPGSWHLQGTTIFPSQPCLSTFLWTTPPNRGADEISRYHHPSQSHVLPPSHLSILARYLQHTAFTCTAMEAEFQVVWGRKVRYDSVLGRVRATYDHALKGAKTQAEKRKRGEYNRPIGKSGLSVVKNATAEDGEKEEGGSRPGAGETLEFLSGKNVSADETGTSTGVEAEGQDITGITAEIIAARETTGPTGRSLSERLRRILPRTANPSVDLATNTPNARARDGLSEDTALTYHPTTIKAERPRKRLKRERRDEASGSEYSDPGSDED